MLHVQIHPFLVQTLSLSVCTRPSFSSRLPIRISLSLSLSRFRFSFGGLHARTHAHPREDQYKRGRSVGYRADTRSSGRRASPKKALTKPRQRGGSPLFAQQQSSFGGTPASTARVGKDNEEREPSRESMPRSQLDVVLRVRIGLTPLKRGVLVERERVPLSFFLSFFLLFFSFLFFSLVAHYPSRPVSRFKYFGRVDDETVCATRFPFVGKKKREITKKKKRIARSREIRSASSLVLLPSLAIKLMRLLFTGFLYRIRSFFRFYYTILCLSSVHRRPFCRPVFAATGSTGVEGDPRLFEYTRYAKCAKWRTRVLHLLKAISAKPPTKPFLLCHGSPLSLSLSRSISMRLSSNPLLGSLG